MATGRTGTTGRTIAASFAVAGAVGLGLLALPGGAGAAPELPPVTPEDLVASVIAADPGPFAGTAELDNALGLPALPDMPQAASGTSTARIWSDGDRAGRVSLPTDSGERTLVSDGQTFWAWNSEDRTAVRSEGDHAPGGAPEAATADPAAVAAEVLGTLSASSEVSVDGTAEVAGRPAYELVLAPAPSERTLLREVRIAVDAENRMPLQLTVLATGSSDPALQLGFTDIEFGQQDPSLFTFTPPPGATVEDAEARRPEGAPGKGPDGVEPTVVGEGWDTVIVATMPTPDAAAPEGAPDSTEPDRSGDAPDLASLGTPVSGPWGSGRLITTAVAAAIITDDGRIAAGAVPEQVLAEALSR